MILIPIFLAFFTGLLILRLCNQHKYINIFEQLALGFVSALSLFVFELFLQGIILNHLSLLFPVITFVVCLGLLIYKNNKHKGFVKEIFHHIKLDLHKVKEQFNGLKIWQKYVVIGITVYVLFKLVMVFSINLHMPTFDDDAVTGRDLKTKIFSENKSLVLDKSSPEYLGSALERNIFAPLTDTYFLLSSKGDINGYTNIASALFYFISILILFGIFLRKTNLFFATLSGYIFTSLPFVFVHGIGSYWNFPAGVFLFVFVFYLIDQIFHWEKDYGGNTNILLPILFVGFISSVIRNEGVMLTGVALFSITIFYHIFKKGKIRELKYQLLFLSPIVFAYVLNKIILIFYPTGVALNTGGIQVNSNLFNSFFANISQSNIFIAPFQQMFYHPDYILLFLLFVISLIMFVMKYKKMKNMWLFGLVTIMLLFVFMFTLYANVHMLGLLTHFAFIRYPVSVIPFIIYTIVYCIYLNLYNHEY
ncbi:MAG: hypothetical protein WC872_00460 [Candidatus Absconditabacterales bacterium]